MDEKQQELKARLTEDVVFEPYEFQVTPEFNEQYLFAVQDYHPRYIKVTEASSPIVHPSLLLNQSNATRSPSYKSEVGMAGLHAKDEVEFLNPGRVGKTFRVMWKVVDGYEKRGKFYTVIEAVVVDEDGLQILRRRSHSVLIRG